MKAVALRAAVPRASRAEVVVREFCAALVRGERVAGFLAREFTWLGVRGAIVRVDAWSELRAIPLELVEALPLADAEAVFLVDLERGGRTATAAIAVDREGAIARLFDPIEIFGGEI